MRFGIGREPLLSVGLVALVVASTFWEGGGSPRGLLLVHTLVLGLLLVALLVRPKGVGAVEGSLPQAPTVLFVLLLVVAGVGAWTSPYAYGALLAWTEMLVFGAVAWLAARRGRGLLDTLALPVLAVAAAQAIVGAGQAFDGAGRAAGTFLNASHLGAWLVAAILLGSPTGLMKARAASAALRLGLTAFALFGLYLTRSRGALIGLAAGALCLLAWLWRDLRPRARGIVLAVVGAGILLGVVGLAARARARDPLRYHRLGIWQASVRLSLERPWTGSGPGQFAAAARAVQFPIEEGPLRFERRFTGTHSDLLRLPCELGWPATLLGLTACLLAARCVRRGLRAGPPVALGAAAALVALATQALVENLSDRPAVVLLAAMLLGTLLSRPAGGRPAPPRAAGWIAAPLLLAAYVIGDLAPYGAWALVHELPRGRLDPPSRRRLDRALELNPLHPDLWMRRAENLAGAGRDWTPPVYAEAREAAERALRLQPADSAYRLRRARLEGLACLTLLRDERSRERTAALYEDAEALAPKDALLAIEKGRFLLDAGDPAGARRAAERALRLEPQGVAPRLLLAEALLALGGEGARQAAARALDDAVAAAARWGSEPRISAYAGRLLDLDARRAQELRRRIEGEA